MTLKVKNIKSLTDANREELRKSGAKNVSDTLLNVPYDDIVVRKCGESMFNPRTVFEGIEELAKSIEAVGLSQPLWVKMQKDGSCVLVDGERRFRAITLLRSKNSENKVKYASIRAYLVPKDMSEVELQLLILSTQAAQAFDPMDEARRYHDLKAGWMGEPGLSLTEIARRIGKPISHVESRLQLLKATAEEQEMIASGKTTVTAFAQLARKEADPVKRTEKIREANAKGEALKVKDVKRSDLAILANDQLAILKDIQLHPELKLAPKEVIAWIQEVDVLARKILKLA